MLLIPHTCSDVVLSALRTGLRPIVVLQGQNQYSFQQRKDLELRGHVIYPNEQEAEPGFEARSADSKTRPPLFTASFPVKL